MGSNRFDAPVRLYMGLNVAREIGSPLQAYAFLNDISCDWTRDEHAAAKLACLRALRGEGDVRTARTAFERFADRMGILASAVDDVSVILAPASGGARVAA